jgi:hypothetical protein
MTKVAWIRTAAARVERVWYTRRVELCTEFFSLWGRTHKTQRTEHGALDGVFDHRKMEEWAREEIGSTESGGAGSGSDIIYTEFRSFRPQSSRGYSSVSLRGSADGRG